MTVCPPSGGSGGSTAFVNAGTVHVTAPGSTPVSLASLPAPGTAGYWTTSGLLWHAGQLVTIAGDGAAVPAFTGSITFPDTASISAPVADVGTGRVALDRSAGVDVRWTGGTGSVDVGVFQQIVGAPQIVTVWCVFDAAAGAGNVPASALSDLAPRSGTTGVDTQFQVSSGASQTVTSGAYSIVLGASQADFTGEADVR